MRKVANVVESGGTSLNVREPWLRWAGRGLGPLLGVAVYLALAGGDDPLSAAGRWTAALAVTMAVLWITEALPLPVTSLLPILFFPLAGVSTVFETTSAYANEVIFLFMGGFILALGMEKWGLHRRIALRVLSLAGTRPTTLVAGFMAASAFLSMWINNTSTTVMMLPIALSILRLVEKRVRDEEGDGGAAKWQGFGVALMLAVAYAASIGSVSTLIGTPPNLLLRGFVQRTYGIELGFGTWMLACLPLSLLLLGITWFLLTRLMIKDRTVEVPGGKQLVAHELASLGPMGRGEKLVLVVFVGTALCWVLREPATVWLSPWAPFLSRLTDPGIAMAAGLLLFALPVDPRQGRFVMDWETAERLPWGVLLLFGGGLTLAGAIQRNGVDAWLGNKLALLGALPLWALALMVVTAVVFLTELTSNTAVTATFLPVLGGVATALEQPPLVLLLPAAVAASCAFMMPVATPPNAIVFASGYVTIHQMARIGFWLNLVSVALITLFAFSTARLLWG
jgi:solute carrier family 13 (sodium-dependent dicarboxylate transporter), member 2/3/5